MSKRFQICVAVACCTVQCIAVMAITGADLASVSDADASKVFGAVWTSCNYRSVVDIDGGCTIGCEKDNHSLAVKQKNSGKVDDMSPCQTCTGYFSEWASCSP